MRQNKELLQIPTPLTSIKEGPKDFRTIFPSSPTARMFMERAHKILSENTTPENTSPSNWELSQDASAAVAAPNPKPEDFYGLGAAKLAQLNSMLDVKKQTCVKICLNFMIDAIKKGVKRNGNEIESSELDMDAACDNLLSLNSGDAMLVYVLTGSKELAEQFNNIAISEDGIDHHGQIVLKLATSKFESELAAEEYVVKELLNIPQKAPSQAVKPQSSLAVEQRSNEGNSF